MDDDRQTFEFAHALYLARQFDREAAQMIVETAEAGLTGIEQATQSLALLASHSYSKLNLDDQLL